MPIPTFAQRLPWHLVTWSSVSLAAAGAILPLLPTTPFLLIAAWAAPKSSPRLNTWLNRHPVFGPALHAWRDQRAIPARAKAIAVLLLLASWIGLWAVSAGAMLPWLMAILFCLVAAFLLSRPNAGGGGNE